VKREMENVVTSRQSEDSVVLDSRKLPVMRALARLHECDVETLCSGVDASDLDVHDILMGMVSRNEVEESPQPSGGARAERFTLTLRGWGEYLQLLGSIYELTE